MSDLPLFARSPGRLGAVLGAALGAAFALPIAFFVGTTGLVPSNAPFVLVLLGATAAGLPCWLLGSFALRRPLMGFLWVAFFTYVGGILLFPIVIAIVPATSTPGLLGTPPAIKAIATFYQLTPFALVVCLPLLAFVVPGAAMWVVAEHHVARRWWPALLAPHPGATGTLASFDSQDRFVNVIGLGAMLVALVAMVVAASAIANLTVGY